MPSIDLSDSRVLYTGLVAVVAVIRLVELSISRRHVARLKARGAVEVGSGHYPWMVVVPDEPLVTTGPFRWMRHPNYVAVIVEFAALPMVHAAWLSALVFGTANALVLRHRIRVEETALGKSMTAGDPAQLIRGRS